MQTVTGEETKAIKRFIGFVLLPFFLCIIMVFVNNAKIDNVSSGIESYKRRIHNIARKYKGIPTVNKLNEARSELKRIKEVCSELKTNALIKPIYPPDSVIERGVYFKKQLFLAHKKLKSIAAKDNIKLPESLGFSEALPGYEEVAVLLRKLETLNSVLLQIMDAGVKNITMIKMLDDNMPDELNNNMKVTEIGFRIDVEASPIVLARTLLVLGNLKPYIAVKSIAVKKIKKGYIEVGIIVSRLILEKDNEN